MPQRRLHQRLLGLLPLALGLALVQPASGFLLPPPLRAAPAAAAGAGAAALLQPQPQPQLGAAVAAAALVGRRRAVGGSGGDAEEASNTPGQGGMPDLEGMVGRPNPIGGESQYDYAGSEYPDQAAEIEYFGDDELLARYRSEMQVSNDQWQLDVFMKAQAGTWSGVWSEYTPVPNGGAAGETVFRMTNIYKGRQECVGDADARVARWRELTLLHAPDGGPLAPAMVSEREMLPANFRSVEGSMAADNVFSCSALSADGTAFDAEIWIREGGYRTRVSFHYAAPATTAALALEKVLVKKERLGKQGPTAEEPELFGANGRGIYDRTSRTPGSWDLMLHGGLSLSFPPELPRDAQGAVIVDWVAGRMRYQADRIFQQPDGTLQSLEVTQIGSADSMLYTIPEAVPAQEGEEADGEAQ